MNIKHFSVLIIAFTAVSCLNKSNQPLLPAASGAPGDVLVVMNNSKWESAPGEAVRNVLSLPMEAIPQDEPKYDIINIQHHAFSNLFKKQRSILVTKIGKDQSEVKSLVQKNMWAKGQIIITVVAPSDSAFIEYIENNAVKIISLLDNMERHRLMKAFESSSEATLIDKIIKKHNIKIIVPKGYKLGEDKNGFIWLTHAYRDIIQGILIYYYPYTDTNTFTRDYLVARRDKILKQNVPGDIEGSYMQTELLFPPIMSEYKLNNKIYTAELRGLWRMENGLAMGGPFISITQLDEKRNRVVTAEGFVYAPAHKKRDLLRQVEAIILSMEFTDNQSNEK
ncbi:MAG: DUF4837 family protein [Bacteroidales bacterium]|nr:DUF4837 family protein [Bacteroidales bacterium]